MKQNASRNGFVVDFFFVSVIRLNMPPVTEDRRKELAKEAKALGEEGKAS